MIKFLVVGSPGRYTVKPVNPGDADYESGMSEQAAKETAVNLNNQFFEKIGETPTTIEDVVVQPTSQPTPQPTQTTKPALTNESKSKVVALQKELGVAADGIVGPQTIAAAKAKIANSRSYSEVVGLSKKYDLILNVDKYKTATKVVSAPVETGISINEDKVAEAVDLFTTALFPPTAVAKAITGDQEITGADQPTSVDIAGEWVMIDREGFTVFKDKDILKQLPESFY